MKDYAEVVMALKICSGFFDGLCDGCAFGEKELCKDELLASAAAAIEELTAEVERLNIALQGERKEHAEDYKRLRDTYISESERLTRERECVKETGSGELQASHTG